MRFLSFALLVVSVFGWYQSTAQAQLDLSVDQISKHRGNIQIRVRNPGSRRTPATKLNVWMTDNSTGNALKNRLLDVSQMNPGGSHTFVVRPPNQKSSMTRHLLITAKVDPAMRIRESNERNNLMKRVIRMGPPPAPTKPVPVQRLPDSRISNINKRGKNFVVKIMNYGDKRSKPCILATWAVDKQTLKVTKVERYVPAINIGATHQVVVDRIPAANGKVTITSVIDVRKKIAERIETNNRMEKTFAPAKPVVATADLVVQRIEFRSPTLVDVTIRNQGSTTTGGRFRVQMEVFTAGQTRRLHVATKTTPRLGSMQTVTLQFESKVRILRPMIVRVMPDVNNVIRETSERNNPTLRVR